MSRVVYNDISNAALPFYRQLRGKKQASREPKTITVKLLKDVVGYGPQGLLFTSGLEVYGLILSTGSIVKMVPGRMRNHLYPKQHAAYITEAQLREFKKQGAVFERDMDFGKEKPEEEEDSEMDFKVHTEDVTDVEIKLLPVSYLVFVMLGPQKSNLSSTIASKSNKNNIHVITTSSRFLQSSHIDP